MSSPYNVQKYSKLSVVVTAKLIFETFLYYNVHMHILVHFYLTRENIFPETAKEKEIFLWFLLGWIKNIVYICTRKRNSNC